MAPTMLHVFSDLSALASNADIKEAILTNYLDIPEYHRGSHMTTEHTILHK